ARLDALRAAARLECRQTRRQAADTRHLLPLAAVPALDARRLAFALEAQQGGDGLDLQPPGALKLRVVPRAIERLAKARIVLAIGRELARALERGERRHHQRAGGAVAFDDGYEAGVAHGDILPPSPATCLPRCRRRQR